MTYTRQTTAQNHARSTVSRTICRDIHTPDLFFFFNDTATTEIYTLSLHDALPIFCSRDECWIRAARSRPVSWTRCSRTRDRKSTRLNSSHVEISYAVFCLKKKKKTSKHSAPRIPYDIDLRVDLLSRHHLSCLGC